jgi:hypothetical protein
MVRMVKTLALLAILIAPLAAAQEDQKPRAPMSIAVVTAPAAGKWRLELDGEGIYAVSARVKATEDIAGGQTDFIAFDGTAIASATPAVPHRVRTRGVDRNGVAFQRVESTARDAGTPSVPPPAAPPAH